MSYSTTASFAGMTPQAATSVRRPVQHPTAIMAARARNNTARNNTARMVARSQYASKPLLLVATEYAVGITSLCLAVYLSLGL